MNDEVHLLTFNDFLGVPVVLIFFFLLIKWLAPKYIPGFFLKLFYFGLFLRIFGIIGSLLFYVYVEKAGDTHAYFSYGNTIASYAANNGVDEFVRLIFSNYHDLPLQLKAQLPLRAFFAATFEGNKLIIMITSIISFFTFGSYLAMSIVFTLFGYFGVWLIFYRLSLLYPKLYLYFFFLILCWPTLVFFGAGILKEALCLGALGILFYIAFDNRSSKTKLAVLAKKSIIIVCAGAGLFYIKPYLFVSFAIGFFFARVSGAINIITDKKYRGFIYSSFLLFILSFIGFIFMRWNYFISSPPMLKLYTFILSSTKAQLVLGNSKYDLGELEMTQLGVSTYLIKALNVSLFRPYITEMIKPQLFISGIESLLMLVLAVYTLFKVGVYRFFASIKNTPLLVFSFFFVVFVGVQIGAISFNFGALIRYKIPLLPFYFSFFVIMLHKNRRNLHNVPPAGTI